VTNETFPWDRLLDLVKEKRVIPVVGSDLLVVERDGTSTTVDAYCAAEMVRCLEFDGGAAETGSLSQLAAMRGSRQARDLQGAAWELREELERGLPVPATLLQLAALPFPLFLTTTFDPMLRRALDQVRFGGKPKTRVLAYYPGDRVDDLPEPLERLDGATVFHLFGRLQAAPYFAVSDEDILECVLGLQGLSMRDDKGSWRHLFGALSCSSLLLLGTSFSDWLARFFLRIAAQQQLSSSCRLDFITDTGLERDQGLVLFLQKFASGTGVFLEGGPVKFLRQLHERWTRRYGAALPTGGSGPKASAPMERGAVFVSYASEDRAAVQSLCAVLEAEEIDVWFDLHELSAGDAWKQRVRRNIEEASCFVAILSRHSLTSQRREFRYEWKVAAGQQETAPDDLPFILPVAVDDVEEKEARLDSFRPLHWERAPGGHPSTSLVEKLRTLIRSYRASEGNWP